MAKCKVCGNEVSKGTVFCDKCGAPIEEKNAFDELVSKNETAEKILSFVDKCGKFVGVILLVLAISIVKVRPAIVQIILAFIFIVGAVFCLLRKYKWKGVTIAALIVSIACLISGCSHGKEVGFFTMKSEKAETKVEDDSYEKLAQLEAERAIAEAEAEKAKAEAEAEKAKIQAEAEIEKAKAEAEKAKTESSDTDEAAKEENAEMAEGEEPATETETEDANAQDDEASDAKDEDAVDPDLKAFLDEYEEFMDEYVDFMKKYNSDPGNTISMLKDYTEMMLKYTEMAEKADKYDEDEMSKADAKYYIEVMSRCEQKLLEIE